MTTKGKSVGSSASRTPGKHDLLRRIVEREAAISQIQGRRYVMLDLCAGDGRPDMHSGTSSAQIMVETRAKFRKEPRPFVALFERDRTTADQLGDSVPTADLILHGDSRTPGHIPDGLWTPSDYVFVHNDPNHVADFALSDDLAARLPNGTTTLSTLGCNVSGLLRMDYEDRLEWRAHIWRVINLMGPRRHDAMIVALDRDSSRWGYLATAPRVHRERLTKDVHRAFDGVWVKGLRVAWLSTERREFNAIADYLFLRVDEQRERA